MSMSEGTVGDLTESLRQWWRSRSAPTEGMLPSVRRVGRSGTISMTTPLEAASEAAKAVQEVAKTSNTVVQAGRDGASWFGGRLTGTLDAAIGWAMTDNIEFARAARAIKHRERLRILAHQAEQRLYDLGITNIQSVPEKVAVALIEAAVLEDEPDLQRLWANLLASALSIQDERHKQFTGILADLSASDARALTAYAGRTAEVVTEAYSDAMTSTDASAMSGEAFGIAAVRNLARLGLMEPAAVTLKFPYSVGDVPYGGPPPQLLTDNVTIPGDLLAVVMTETGTAFCEAIGIPVVSAGETSPA